MTINRRVSDIKRAQKASLLLQTIAPLISQAMQDNKNLNGLFVNRVELSPDKGTCYVLFYCLQGEDEFNKKLPELILYKPSLRAALARQINGRYTPEIIFKYDAVQSHVDKIENLLQDLKDKGEL